MIKQIIGNIISIILVGGIYLIYEYLKNKVGKSPDRKHERNMQEMQERHQKNMQEMQEGHEKNIKEIEKEHEKNMAFQANEYTKKLKIEAFYKNIKGQDLMKINERLIDLAVEMKMGNSNEIKKLVRDIIAYGSKEVTRRMAIFQEYNYKYSEEYANNKDKLSTGYFLIVYVAVQFKYDYTNLETEPMDILKIKINDLEENKDVFIEANKKAKELLGI